MILLKLNNKISNAIFSPNQRFLAVFKLSFKSWSIVFFGTDNFSVKSLTKIHAKVEKREIKAIEVVTVNDSCSVYKYAISNGLKAHIWPPNLTGSYDFGVIVSFGKLIPQSIIAKFPLGIINLHASLLPKWRGAMPIIHCIKNGENVTGVTIIKIDAKFDTGNILYQKSLNIDSNEVMPSLYNRLGDLASKCLVDFIDRMPNSLEESIPQSNEGITYAPKIDKTSAVVKWNEMTALEVYNLYRALLGVYHLRTSLHEVKIKILCLSLVDFEVGKLKKTSPGKFFYSVKDPALFVQCKDKPLQICTLSVKGKIYTAKDFYRGYIGVLPESKRYFGS